MELLERHDEMSIASDMLAKAERGHGSSLFVVGAPGLGKTAFLRALSFPATRFTVSSAGCSAPEAALPFGVIQRLMGMSGALPDMGATASGNPADARVARFATLMGWVANRAGKPLLITVDDLHWADPDSAQLLFLLCRRIAELPVVVVATMRPWPQGAAEEAQALANSGMAGKVTLEPLSRAAAGVLLTTKSPFELAEDVVERAWVACDGNPLLLEQLVESWRRGEDPLYESGTGFAERLFLPGFAGVSTVALRWAKAAAVLGIRFKADLAGELAGLPPQSGWQVVEALCAAGLLRGVETGEAEFVHPLVRQALYEAIDPLVRQQLHAEALHLLIARDADPALIAVHAAASGGAGGSDAVEVLVSAGHGAIAAGAMSAGRDHLATAVAVGPPSTLRAVWIDLAAAEIGCGRVGAAEKTLRRMLGDPSLATMERIVGLRLLGQVRFTVGDIEGAKRCSHDASGIAKCFDGGLAAEVLLDAAMISWLFEGVDAARSTASEAIDLLKSSPNGSDSVAHMARVADANLAVIGGDPSGVAEVSAAAEALLDGVEFSYPSPPWPSDAIFGFASLMKILERLDLSSSVFHRGAAEAKRHGAAIHQQIYAVGHADTLCRLGRLDEARSMLEEATQAAEVAPALAPFASIGMAVVAHELGLAADSDHWAGRVELILSTIGESPYLRLWLSMLDSRAALRAGRVVDAVAAAEYAWVTALESGIREPCVVPWHGTAIDALIAARQLARASELIEFLDGLCAPLPCQAPRAVVAVGRATVAWKQGRLSEADSMFDEAVARTAHLGMPLVEAEISVAYGRFLRNTGRPLQARKILRRVLQNLAGTGAGRLQVIAEEELAASGGRRRKPVDRPGLTSQEARVARLAAEGLTNSQIATHLYISAKTVDHHLSAAYDKLGISSRRDLMIKSSGLAELLGSSKPASI